MEPNNNVQNEATTPVVTKPMEAPETTPETPSMVVQDPDKKQTNKGMILGMVLLAILAIGGIGFGVWTMMDGNQQKEQLNTQINTLKTQNSELLEKINGITVDDDIEIDVNNAYKNPIIKSDSSDVFYAIGFQSTYILGQDSTRRVGLNVVNGAIENCDVTEQTSDGGWQTVGECSINGISGNIYKVVEFGEGQENGEDMIGFIMEDGKVAYVDLYDFASSTSLNIKGYLNIDGYVIDALRVGVGNGVAGGYRSTVFVLSNGTYVKYDSSMIK